jgi:hypothetical protein
MIENLRLHKLGRKRILDTHLASILNFHNIHHLLTFNVSDFSVFPFLQVISTKKIV